MSEIIIVVDSIEEKFTKSDNPYLCVSSTDGKKYNIFDNGVFNLFAAGLTVKLIGAQEGKFFNVSGAESVETSTQPTPEAPQSTARPATPPTDTIAPQEVGMWWKHKAFALSYSKDLVCSGSIEAGELFQIADQMLDWLNTPMV